MFVVFTCYLLVKMSKRTKKTVLNSECREFVVRLREYFERENQNGGPLLPLAQVCDRVADALGIGRTTVSRISKEKYGETSNQAIEEETEKKLSTPNKKRKKACPVTDIDDFDGAAIRNHIYAYYRRGEYPTLKKLAISLKDANLFHGSIPSLAKVLKNIGFAYKKSDKRKIIMERTDIALARVHFLRKAKNITDWDKVVFLDETWLNANHTVSRSWTDDKAESTSKVPEGKGQRLIITHAGTSSGFVPNCLLAFKSLKTTEYHEEMNFEKFKEWFLTLLNNLNEPHVIIMDNAPYHSVQKNKPPTSSNRKMELIAYLQSIGVEANEQMLKNELLKLVHMNKPRTPTYILDELAKEKGHTVIRLPPYHCQYNAIELIWAHVKGHAARNNTKPPFTANKMLALLHNACEDVTPELWKKVVDKCKKIIDEDWERDIQFDNLSDQDFIINLQDCSSESESDYDESDLGCAPLY